MRQAEHRIAAGCSQFGIAAQLHRRARELPGGTRRKVERVRAPLHRPAVLLMGEAAVRLAPKSPRDPLGATRRK
ncbi:MAG: hypothetical protein AB1761_10650 [Pseudomonadota bacterium]